MPRPGSAPPPPPEEDLLQRVRDGDTAAFTQLRATHLESARELARELAGGKAADALVAQAFDRILEQLRAGRGPSTSFRAYLHATIRDRHRDLLRNSRLDQVQPTRPRPAAVAAPGAAALPVERPGPAAASPAAKSTDAASAAAAAEASPATAPASKLPVDRSVAASPRAAQKPSAKAPGDDPSVEKPAAGKSPAATSPAAKAPDVHVSAKKVAASAAAMNPAAQLPVEKPATAKKPAAAKSPVGKGAAKKPAAAASTTAPPTPVSTGTKAPDAKASAAMPASVALAADGEVAPEGAPVLGRVRGLAPRVALALRGLSSRTAVVAGATLMLVAAAAALWIGIQTNDAEEPRADQVIVDPQEVQDPELRRIPGEVPFLAPLTGGSDSPSSGTDVTGPSDLSGTDPSDPFPTAGDTDVPGDGLPGTQPPGTDSPTDDPSTPAVEVRAVAPNASPITSCGSYGSLNLPDTTGVRYRLATGNGREGPWEVRASAIDGYALADGSPSSFSGNLGDYYACPSIRSVSKVNVGGNDRGAWQITLGVDAPGPGPRTLEARFVFDNTTRIHGSSGAGWDCGSGRIVGAGTPVTCSVVVDGGSPAALVLSAERVRLFRSTEPTGSVSLHEGGVQRGSAGF